VRLAAWERAYRPVVRGYRENLTVHRELEKKHEALKARIAAAIQEDARDVGDGEIIAEARTQLSRFLLVNDPQIWRARLDAAREQIEPARRALEEKIDENAVVLARELEPAAHGVAKRLGEELSKAESALAPLRKEHDEIADALATILGRTRPTRLEEIPKGDYSRAPFVNEDVLARAELRAESPAGVTTWGE
jgi:hypothetical protein